MEVLWSPRGSDQPIFEDFMALLKFKMAQNRLLEVQGTGKSIKNGSTLFGVFSPTWAQHNAIVTDPESLLDIAGRSVGGDPADSGKQCKNNSILENI